MKSTQLKFRMVGFSSNSAVSYGLNVDVFDEPSGNMVARAYFTHEEAGKLLSGRESVTFQAEVATPKNAATYGKKHEYKEVGIKVHADEPFNRDAWDTWAKEIRLAAQRKVNDHMGAVEGWIARGPNRTNKTYREGDPITVIADRYVET